MKITINGVVGTVIGILGTAYVVYREKQMQKLSKKLDLSLEDVSRKSRIDIQQSVVDKAVVKSVDREVHNAVEGTVAKIKTEVRDDMNRAIRKEVDDAYTDIRSKVEDKVANEVSKLDIDLIKKGVKEKVENRIFQEFWSGVNRTLGFGNNSNRNINMSDLKNVIELLPSWERKDALTSIFGGDDRE